MMSTVTRSFGVLVVGVLPLALAGCGGSGGPLASTEEVRTCLRVPPGQHAAYVRGVINRTGEVIVLHDVKPVGVSGATVLEVFTTEVPVLSDATHLVPGSNGPWPTPEPTEWRTRTPVSGTSIDPGADRGIVMRVRSDVEGGGFDRVEVTYAEGGQQFHATWQHALTLDTECEVSQG